LLAEAIAQDPTSALDAAQPAVVIVVDALNTATGALYNLHVVPAGVTRRDTTDDVAHLMATILDVRVSPERRVRRSR
jgi:hypothetical protein